MIVAVAAIVVGAAASTLPSRASGQTLKLHALHLPAQDLVGTWVSFHGRSQSRGSPVREFDQRLAVVSKEDLGRGRWGLWVELKTTDARGGSRIERGLFAAPSLRGKDLLPGGDGSKLGLSTPGSETDDPSGNAASDAADEGADLVLVRYQAMNGNKLYEYPVGAARHARSGGEVSSFELFEYDPGVTPIRSTVGPDTLRLGRRIVPSVVERVRRFGTDEWPSDEDSTGIQRLVLTQTFWRNEAVPLIGYARSVFRADMRHIPWNMTADSLLSGVPRAARPNAALLAEAERVAAQADSLLQDDPITPGTGATPTTLAWTELVLGDLGADATPEIDQEPELPPDQDAPEEDTSGFQR